MLREAETFRNDYRDQTRRIVFHALKKPIPFMKAKTGASVHEYVERDDEIETRKYCGLVLAGIILGCGGISIIMISRQNRETR